METVVLDRDAVERNARMGDVIPAVEAAFAAYQRDDVEMPAKSYVELPEYNGDFRSMPAYMHAQGNGTRDEWDAAAVKWVNVHPDNPGDYDLPTVMGTVIYSDPETGFPLSIMDGTELTRQRTGAAAAVATDHLAVVDATSLGIVGADEDRPPGPRRVVGLGEVEVRRLHAHRLEYVPLDFAGLALREFGFGPHERGRHERPLALTMPGHDRFLPRRDPLLAIHVRKREVIRGGFVGEGHHVARDGLVEGKSSLQPATQDAVEQQ